MSIILCIKNYNFNAKNERKTLTCPITSACPITKPKVYLVAENEKLKSKPKTKNPGRNYLLLRLFGWLQIQFN
jgi:hypothetical protein